MDVFSKEKRSEVMSHIRSSGNNDTELALISFFKRRHITGWRRNQKVFGKPDFVFRKKRLAMFVDGCFWHGCSQHCSMPKNNENFWKKKLGANIARDREVSRRLRTLGWKVVRIWEHELTAKNESRLLAKVTKYLD